MSRISENVLEALANGPVRGLRNWPAMRAEILRGNVEARPVDAKKVWYVYTLSNRGRRRRLKFWGRFA